MPFILTNSVIFYNCWSVSHWHWATLGKNPNLLNAVCIVLAKCPAPSRCWISTGPSIQWTKVCLGGEDAGYLNRDNKEPITMPVKLGPPKILAGDLISEFMPLGLFNLTQKQNTARYHIWRKWKCSACLQSDQCFFLFLKIFFF